jgi:TetR/AcrR family transcriptional regulator, transcriptional repressor of bet genes
MPKQVDREQRRREIAWAVWQVAAERGLESVSLRNVAAAGGISMGRVQHYFGSRDEMILFSCRHLVELAGEGLEELAAGNPADTSAVTVIRNVALQSLPLDDRQRMGASVWYSFLRGAVTNPPLAEYITQVWTGTHELLTRQIVAAQQAGDIEGTADPSRAAHALLCLIDGLTSHLLVGHYTPEMALGLLEAHLDGLTRGQAISTP